MNWQEKDNKLSKEFEFKNFVQAIAFVNKVGLLSEEENHHPDILIHDYKHVRVTLTTHDKENTITQKDKDLAKRIDEIN